MVDPGAFLEVADHQLLHGMVAVIGVEENLVGVAVGDEGVVAPVRPQRCLPARQPGAAHDQPALEYTLEFGARWDARRESNG